VPDYPGDVGVLAAEPGSEPLDDLVRVYCDVAVPTSGLI
jgi:hypothetical protein